MSTLEEKRLVETTAVERSVLPQEHKPAVDKTALDTSERADADDIALPTLRFRTRRALVLVAALAAAARAVLHANDAPAHLAKLRLMLTPAAAVRQPLLRAALTLALDVPIAACTNFDSSVHFDAYARAAGGNPFAYRDGLAVPAYSDVARLLSATEQPRRLAVLAHPLVFSQPVPAACMGKGTLIFLPSGERHAEMRAIVHDGLRHGFEWRYRQPPGLAVGGRDERLRLPAGVSLASAQDWTPEAVRAVVLHNIYARLLQKEPTAQLLETMLGYYNSLPQCLLSDSVPRRLLDAAANATRRSREALRDSIKDTQPSRALSIAAGMRGVTSTEVYQQVADGILFAGGYGTTHLALAALERIRLDPARHVPQWRRNARAFLLECARLDTPVTGVAVLAPEGGTELSRRDGTSTEVAAGTPLQLLISAANRDPSVFSSPYTFNPERRNLHRILTWNGILADVEAGSARRGCPGVHLSMDVAAKIVSAALPSLDAPAVAPVVRAALLHLETSLDHRGTPRSRPFRFAHMDDSDAATYAYYGASAANALGGLLMLLVSPPGECTISVSLFLAAHLPIALGWLLLTQRLGVGDVYLPGDSGLVVVKDWLGMMHFGGYLLAGFALLRLGIVLRLPHNVGVTSEFECYSNTRQAFYVAVAVWVLVVAVFACFGTAVSAEAYATICCSLYVPGHLLVIVQATRFWWRDGAPLASRGVIVLLGVVVACISMLNLVAEALGTSTPADRLASAFFDTARAPLGGEVAAISVAAQPLVLLLILCAAAVFMDTRLAQPRNRAFPPLRLLRRLLWLKYSAPLAAGLVIYPSHRLLIPYFTADLLGCRAEESSADAATPAAHECSAECLFDPTQALDLYTSVFLKLIHALDDGSQPDSSAVGAPRATARPLPKTEALPGVMVPLFDEDEGLGTANALANQVFDWYMRSETFFPLADTDASWQPASEPLPEFARGDVISEQLRRLMGSISPPNQPYTYGTGVLARDEGIGALAFGGLAAHTLRRIDDAPGGDSSVGGDSACAQPAEPPALARWCSDLSWMCALDVREGFVRYGAIAYFDADASVTAIWVSHLGELFEPNDDGWAHARWAYKVSALVGVTLRDHLVGTHLVIGNALASASRDSLAPRHPLRRLLKPFSYRTIVVNRGARALLCKPRSLLHRATALTEAALEEGFNSTTAKLRQRFDPASGALLDYVDGVRLATEAEPTAPFFADAKRLRDSIERFVAEYVSEYYADDAQLLDDAEASRFWEALRGEFRSLRALGDVGGGGTARQLLSRALSGLIFHVTAVHTHVGAAIELVKDPRFAGSKLRAGAVAADVQAGVQALSIALVTGFRQPALRNDWSHLLVRDARLNATRRILAEWQDELGELGSENEKRNRARRWRVNAFNPRFLASSVSI